MRPGVIPDIARERMYDTPYQNSTLLSLLLFSLATQKHTPDTKKHFRLEYDYIIVGAGSAGSVLASRLSEERCVSVLLLEAGKPPPLLSDLPPISMLGSEIDWNYITEPQKHAAAAMKNQQIAWPLGKTLGGTSVLNAMLNIRGNHKNYDDWEQLGAKGWSWKEVFPYFLKLEDNKDPDIANSEYHSTGGPMTASRPRYEFDLRSAFHEAAKKLGYSFVDPNGANQIGISDFQTTIRKGQRCSTAKAYLVPSEHRHNLDIISEAFVTKIVTRNKTAEGVLFDHKGSKHHVHARREVIVSAGAVNTAKLLMLSGIGPRETLQKFNIPEVANLPVGMNLQDHCASVIYLVVNGVSLSDKLSDTRNIKKYIAKRTGPLASPSGVFGLAFLHNEPMSPTFSLPDHQMYFVESGGLSARRESSILPSVSEKFFGPYANSTVMLCVSCLLNPRSRGNVTIQSANPNDKPIIDPNYLENEKDVEDIVSGLKFCLNISQAPAMQRLGVKPFETLMPGCEEYVNNTDDYLKCYAKSMTLTIYHPAGTAKMGDLHDSTTVLDPELRVKGIHRLRVVDASVMPTVVSGNTNIPVIMIAEKASDIIKKNIQCQ